MMRMMISLYFVHFIHIIIKKYLQYITVLWHTTLLHYTPLISSAELHKYVSKHAIFQKSLEQISLNNKN